MSRWIIALLVLAGAPSHARAVRIATITIANQCPSASSWDKLSACFVAHGWKPKAQRAWPHAKLLDFGQVPAGQQYGVQPALALYVQLPTGWQLGGYFSVADMRYRVIDAQPITINHTTGYRIEIGTREQSPGWVLLHDRVLFCSGRSPECSVVDTGCEFVHEGHVAGVFHGSIELTGHALHVTGDRRLASGVCAPNVTDEVLTWP